MLPYRVKQKYEAMIGALRDSCNSADCGDVATASPILGCFREDDTQEFALFDCVLRLKEWKWRGESGKERINIIVHAREKIRHADGVLLMSSVCVNYVNHEGRFLQAFHFDYSPDQADHPIFHMQVTDRCILLSPDQARELDFAMPAGAAQGMLRGARVPTCDMTLASVLVCLAADHVGGTFFAEFMDGISTLQQEMPLPDIAPLSGSLGTPVRNMRSSHWFRR